MKMLMFSTNLDKVSQGTTKNNWVTTAAATLSPACSKQCKNPKWQKE